MPRHPRRTVTILSLPTRARSRWRAVATSGLLAGAVVASLSTLGAQSSALAGSVTNPTGRTAAALPGAGDPNPAHHVCGNPALLDGPSAPPPGAVVVQPGASLPALVRQYPGGQTTFWLAPGTFTYGPGRYNQVIPFDGDTFIGAPGAVIDGEGVNHYAFGQHATNVTIEYLTVTGFGRPGDNNNEGVLNHDSASGWVITHDTVIDNGGAGVMLGTNDVLSQDCLSHNGQYGFSAYSPQGVANLKVTDNEISGNDTYNWEAHDPGCGCAGGGKFWATNGAVVTGNYVHNNRDVGLWADTDNVGFNISDNVISDNYAQGIIYEISYNALIAHNTLSRNALGVGPTNADFPSAAIYISESGSDHRIGGPYGHGLDISDNLLVNNWSGVVLWESADRFCGSPDNTSTGSCTLVDRPAVSLATCNRAHLVNAHPKARGIDYFDTCRWKTQNVSITHNRFVLSPTAIGPNCTVSRSCGLQGLFSQYGTNPSWSPYRGETVEHDITTTQHNVFAKNTYSGPWHFMVHDQSQVVDFATWQGSWHQDIASTDPGA